VQLSIPLRWTVEGISPSSLRVVLLIGYLPPTYRWYSPGHSPERPRLLYLSQPHLPTGRPVVPIEGSVPGGHRYYPPPLPLRIPLTPSLPFGHTTGRQDPHALLYPDTANYSTGIPPPPSLSGSTGLITVHWYPYPPVQVGPVLYPYATAAAPEYHGNSPPARRPGYLPIPPTGVPVLLDGTPGPQTGSPWPLWSTSYTPPSSRPGSHPSWSRDTLPSPPGGESGVTLYILPPCPPILVGHCSLY
jgi:hypothetical protein